MNCWSAFASNVPVRSGFVGTRYGELNAVYQGADVPNGPGAGERGDEWWRWCRTRDDAGDVDLVELAFVLTGTVAQDRSGDDDCFAEASGAGGRLWVVEPQTGDLGSFPSRSERGFVSAVAGFLKCERGLGELHRRPREVVGERGIHLDSLGCVDETGQGHEDVRCRSSAAADVVGR